MRLTLRTMLAYMDDILEPADRDDIAHKINESEFATQLMQRIRDCIGNSRLGAPRVRGKDVGLDPNAVAEYLDNTLAGERVPDFERVCLQSDVELAEVASCHQILTMVLGRPANVDATMRARMYDIARHVAQFAPAGFVGPDAEHPEWGDEIQITPVPNRPEIPEYLLGRTRGSSWKSIVAGIVLLVLLATAVTLALGPLDHTNPIARLLGIGQKPAEVARNDAAREPDNAGGQPEAPPAGAPESQTPSAADATQAESVATTAEPAESPTEQNPDQPAGADAAPAMVDEAPPPAGEPSAARIVEPAPDQPPAAENSTAEQPADEAAGTASTVSSSIPPATPQPPAETPDVAAGGATVPGAAAPDPSSSPQAASVPNVEAPALPPAEQVDHTPIGRFVPAKGVVLLTWDQESGQWKPLAGAASLSAGERLLVLPTYRPMITLSAGLTLQIPSGTLLELLPTDANGIPGVRLLFGRLVAMTSGQAGSQLRLELGSVTGIVTFVDPQATLGVQLVRSHRAGTNPEMEEPQVSADLYAASGQIQWTDSNGVMQALNAPQHLALPAVPTDAPTDATAQEIPRWIEGEQLSPIDARASAELSGSLEADKPLLLTLREMAEHRRVENKSLAAQSLALLEEFEPLVKVFNDPDQRSMWPAQMAEVREAIDRGPATAAKVREAFEKQRGEDEGRQLYRMFWGYSKDDLQKGEAGKLVDALRHESLDFRVLAFLNLQDITGRTGNYRPESPARGREQAYRRWVDDLAKGQIVPRTK